MNERIKELLIEAGFKIFGNKVVAADNGSSGDVTSCSKKFAELIVRECMDLVKDCYAEPESGQSLYKTACASTIIEEHFGVEE